MGLQGNWKRVSSTAPCPICGKPDNCEVSSDRKMCWCGRMQLGSLRQNQGGQFLHALTREISFSPSSFPSAKRSHPKTNFAALANQFSGAAVPHLPRLAEQLHVELTALRALGVGWSGAGQFWSFPERDAAGRIIGINARSLDGSKKRLRGSHAGLTFSDGWDTGHCPILLVEGGSDTAALLGLGLNVIGRPSNRAGVDLLSSLLRSIDRDREIIFIAERDLKPDGRWPGKEGAIASAEKLSELLDRPVAWSLPPDDAKDARDWLIRTPKLPRDRLADLFVSGLNPQDIRPPRRFRNKLPAGPYVPLLEWRQALCESRIQSLERVGLYVDSSTTGSGKSHADLMAILHLMSLEEAA